jgi:hypothetical protein
MPMLPPLSPVVPREEMSRAPPTGMRVAIFVVVGILGRPVIDFRLHVDALLPIHGRRRRVVMVMVLDDPLARQTEGERAIASSDYLLHHPGARKRLAKRKVAGTKMARAADGGAKLLSPWSLHREGAGGGSQRRMRPRELPGEGSSAGNLGKEHKL